MYKAEPLAGVHKKTKTKTLHRNLLLPLGSNNRSIERDIVNTPSETEDQPLNVYLERIPQHEFNKPKNGISSLEVEESVGLNSTKSEGITPPKNI